MKIKRLTALLLAAALLCAAFALPAAAKDKQPQQLTWPMANKASVVTAPYDDSLRARHHGLDISVPNAGDKNYKVLAAQGGIVLRCGSHPTYGNYVFLYHGGLITTYMHLKSIDPAIKKGASVNAAQTLGYMGSTGRATGPYLFFQVYERHFNVFVPVDPAQYVSKP